MANKEVQIIVSAKDMATQTFKRLEISLTGTTKQLDRLGKSLNSIGKTWTTTLTVPIALAGAGMIKLAADAEQTANKFDVSFQDMANSARQTMNQLADDLGRSSVQMQNFAADAQAILSPMVRNREAAAQMSIALSALAVDLGSFMDVADEDAFNRLISGMLGSTEATERLGISLRESTLQLEADRLGLDMRVASMDDATKIQLRFLAAIRQAKDAQGDAIRTQDDFSNQYKILQANVKDLGIAIGQDLLPFALAAVSWASDMTEEFKKLSPETRKSMLQIAGLVAVAGPLTMALSSVIRGVALLGKSFNLLGNAIRKHPYITATVILAGVALTFDEVREKAEELMRALGLGGLIDTVEEAAGGFKQLEDAAKDIVFDPTAALDDADGKFKQWYKNLQKQLEDNLKNAGIAGGEALAKGLTSELNRIQFSLFGSVDNEAMQGLFGNLDMDNLFLDEKQRQELLSALTKFNAGALEQYGLDRSLAYLKGEQTYGPAVQGLDFQVTAQENFVKLLAELYSQLDPLAFIGVDTEGNIQSTFAKDLQELIAGVITSASAELDALKEQQSYSKVMADHVEQMKNAANMATILGDTYDLNSEQASILRGTIERLVSLGTEPAIASAKLLTESLQNLSNVEVELTPEELQEQQIRQITDLIDVVELFNDDTARQIQEVVNYLNVLPTMADTLEQGFDALKNKISEAFGGGNLGNFLGSLASGYAAYSAFGTGSSGENSLVGTLGSVGTLFGASWGAPLLAVSGLANTLFSGKPKNQADEQLQGQINDYNKMLQDWGAGYRSENLWFKKDSGFLGWRNLFGNQKWETMNKEAALRGAEIAEQLIQSMTTTFEQLGQGLGEVLFSGGGFEDFGKFVGRRLQQVLLEEMLASAAIQGPLQKLSAYIAEAVEDGFSQAELAQINALSQTVFAGLEGWDDMAQQIAEQFGLAEDAAQSIAGTLKNMPSGFKVTAARYDATLPKFHSGGYVPRDMVAELRKGEVVLTPEQVAGGGDVINIYIGTVYGNDDLEQKLAEAMNRINNRRSFARYGLASGGGR